MLENRGCGRDEVGVNGPGAHIVGTYEHASSFGPRPPDLEVDLSTSYTAGGDHCSM
jgi:hypothetical protein